MIENLSNNFNEPLKWIDVGSGPATSYLGKLNIYDYDITTIDPLAKLYNDINKKYQTKYPLLCRAGTGEELDKIFEKNSFHIALSVNAIDHSSSPLKFMTNLYDMVKPGGFIYLEGVQKVGDYTSWKGLHRHNLYIDGENIFWTNKSQTVVNANITGNLKKELLYESVEGDHPGKRYKLVYRKA